MQTYKLNKKFKNYYTKEIETTTFDYEVFDGFPSIEEAKNAVFRLHQQPDCFLYISFKQQIYAVSMETQQRQVVIGSEKMFVRHNLQSALCKTDQTIFLPFIISQPRITGNWRDGIMRDLEQIEGSPLAFTGEKSLLNATFSRYAQHLLGTSFFATHIHVYQLNCVDTYFDEPPSHKDLWAQGVRTINPFTGEKTYANCTIYTLDLYENEKCL